MADIFISYRREDTAGYAGRLYDQLCAHFGEQHVFMDVSDIEPGEDFVKEIEARVHACDTAIVLIGKNWLSKRLLDPGDFVTLEISSALQRNIRVVPVLVEDTRMPLEAEVPPVLAPLCHRQALELTNSMFHEDVGRLIKVLDRDPRAVAPSSPSQPHPADISRLPTAAARPEARPTLVIWATAVIAALLVVSAITYHFRHGVRQPAASPATVAPPGNSKSAGALPSPVVKAIEEGHVDEAKKLIENGSDVNGVGADGTTALMQAAAGSSFMPNNAPAVAMLLDKGARVDLQDNRGRTALYYAAVEGKVDAMRLLLARKADPNHQTIDGSAPLFAAITYGRPAAVTLLLDSGAQVNLPDAQGTTPLAAAAEGTSYMPNNVPLVQILLARGAALEMQDSRGRTALDRAAAEGKTDAVQLLLEHKANANVKTANGTTPLLDAVTYGHQAIVQLLLQHGADVNVADAQGNTPLMIAAEGTAYFPNNVPMTNLLLEAKAIVNAQDSRGRTALYRASTEGKVEAMRLLINQKANPNLQALDGTTPLLEAVTYARIGAANLLLSSGADVNLADSSGNTPLMVVAEGNTYIKSPDEYITLLLSHGAKTNLVDNRGRTALARATEAKNSAAMELLKSR